MLWVVCILLSLSCAQIKQGSDLLEVGKGLRRSAEKFDWTAVGCGETVRRLTFRGVEGDWQWQMI